MSIIKISFFKSSKVRVFNYNPRHWNEEKERLEERKRAIAKEMGVALEGEDANKPYRPNIKGQMQRHLEFGKRKTFVPKGGRIFMLILLVLLFLGAYFGSNLFSLIFSGTTKPAATQQEQPKEDTTRKKNEDTHFIIPLPEKK